MVASRSSTTQAEWDVIEDIPNDSAAALVLLEHHWAVPLRDAIARAGGFRISDGFISPLDLVGIGLMTGRGSQGTARDGDGRERELKEDSMFGSRRVARRTGRRTARRVSRRR